MEDFPVPGDLIVLEDDAYDYLGEVLAPTEPEGAHTVCSEVYTREDAPTAVVWSSATQKFVCLDHCRSRFLRTGPNSWTVGPVINDGPFFLRRHAPR